MAVAALLFALGGGSALAQQAPPAQNALAGSWVFGSKGCASCHAVGGMGRSIGPDLGQGQFRTYYDLAAGFWNHSPLMVERMAAQGIEPPRMNAQDMGDLIAFLTSVNYFGAPGNSGRGQRTFSQKGCIRCHQVGGVGGVLGPGLDYLGQAASPIEVAAAMWNHSPEMGRAMQASGVSMPTLTGAELGDLLAYVRSTAAAAPMDRPVHLLPGRPDWGRRWVTEKGCLKCHAIRGEGATLAPDLARAERSTDLFAFAVSLWNKAPGMLRVMREQGIQVPKLDEAQMADIVAFLLSLRYVRSDGDPDAGRRLIAEKGCLTCHAPEGRGAGRAPNLSAVRNLSSPAAVIASLWNHVPLLTGTGSRVPRPNITPSEMADITAYFTSAAGR